MSGSAGMSERMKRWQAKIIPRSPQDASCHQRGGEGNEFLSSEAHLKLLDE